VQIIVRLDNVLHPEEDCVIQENVIKDISELLLAHVQHAMIL